MTSNDPQPQGDRVSDPAIDRLRDSPVGTNDPNIVGDVGPTDVPPGTDPPTAGQPFEDPPSDESPSLDAMEGPTTYGQPVDQAD